MAKLMLLGFRLSTENSLKAHFVLLKRLHVHMNSYNQHLCDVLVHTLSVTRRTKMLPLWQVPCKRLTGSKLFVRLKHSDDFDYPPLDEKDLEEMFVRGSGPGGQSVNKSNNCVVLKHLPTGIVVKCHETRSLEQNRQRARRHMQEDIDWHYNGSNSLAEQLKRQLSAERQSRKQKTKQRLAKLAAFKEREGIE